MDVDGSTLSSQSFIPFVLESAGHNYGNNLVLGKRKPKTMTLFPLRPALSNFEQKFLRKRPISHVQVLADASTIDGEHSSARVAPTSILRPSVLKQPKFCIGGIHGLTSTSLHNGARLQTAEDFRGSGSVGCSSRTLQSKYMSVETTSSVALISPSLECPQPEHSVADTNATLSSDKRKNYLARHGPRPKSSSFRGVTHYKRTGRWEAHIWFSGKQVYLGASSTAEQAARAYDRAAIHFRKLDAELNFAMEDYAKELKQLMEIADVQLVSMLRKQSVGMGKLYPKYPPVPDIQQSSNQFVSTSPSQQFAQEQQNDPYASTMSVHHRYEHESSLQVVTMPHSTMVDGCSKGRLMDTENNPNAPQSLGWIGTFQAPHHEHQENPILLNVQGATEKIMSTILSGKNISPLHVPQAIHVTKQRSKYLELVDRIISQ